ncbi:MAG: antitoxin VapB family protein [Nanoarchaeota archaeon]
MSTKTLTIMEDVYFLLVGNKLKNESFSDELRRLLTKKKEKGLIDLFGLISEKEGNEMMADLNKIKETDIKLMKEKFL